MQTVSVYYESCLSVHLLQDNEKRTPLHAAAYLGDAEIIELLILSGTFQQTIYVKKLFKSNTTVRISVV